MRRHVLRAIIGRGHAPIDEQRAHALPRKPAEQRIASRQIEHQRRVDQRGHEDHGRAAAAIITQHRAARARRPPASVRPRGAGRFLIGAAARRVLRRVVRAMLQFRCAAAPETAGAAEALLRCGKGC